MLKMMHAQMWNLISTTLMMTLDFEDMSDSGIGIFYSDVMC